MSDEEQKPAGAGSTDTGDAPEAAPSGDAPPVGAPQERGPDEPPARTHRLRDAVVVLVIAAVAFGTGLFVFDRLVAPQLVYRAGEVRVPDFTNLTFEQAEKAAVPLRLQVARAGERFDPNVPRGYIISQDPPADTPVRGHKRVMVMVSLGEEHSSVPELFGESVRNAQMLLERAGLAVGAIARAPSDEVGQGLVVDSDPPAESVQARGTTVSLLVSLGSGQPAFVMPDLLGRELTRTRRQLEIEGFTVLTPPSAPMQGTIVVQDPPPGSRIERETTIMIQPSGRMIR